MLSKAHLKHKKEMVEKRIALPIICLAFGTEGLFAATLFYIPNALLAFTLGVYVASKKHWKGKRKGNFQGTPHLCRDSRASL